MIDYIILYLLYFFKWVMQKCPCLVYAVDKHSAFKIIKGYFVLNIFNFHNAKSSFANTLYRKRGLLKNVRF